MKTCIIYARVSTDMQRDNNSIPTQVKNCKNFLESKGYTLVGDRYVNPDSGRDAPEGIRAFVDDYTSRELSRPALDAAFQYQVNHGFDVVIVHSIDRLARDPYIRQTIEKDFAERGAKVEYALGNYEESPEGEVHKDLEATFAKWEQAKRVERSNRGKMAKAEHGLFVAGRPPYGYIYNREAFGGMEIEPSQAEVVVWIFDAYVNHRYSIYDLVRGLNQSPNRPCDGGEWGKSTVARILANTTYAGYLFYNKYQRLDKSRLVLRDKTSWIKIPCSPIVSPQLFQAAQDMLKNNREVVRRQPKRFYLLSGLLFCGECGKPYVSHASKAGINRRANESISYRHRIREGHCKNKWMAAKIIEPVVWKTIEDLLRNPESMRDGYNRALEKEQSGRARQLKVKEEYLQTIGKLEKRKEKARRAFYDPDMDITKEQYLNDIAQIDFELNDVKDKLTLIESRLSDLPTPEELESLIVFAYKIRERLVDPEFTPTQENKRKILDILHSKVYLNEDGTGRVKGWFDGDGEGLSFNTSVCYGQKPYAFSLPFTLSGATSVLYNENGWAFTAHQPGER